MGGIDHQKCGGSRRSIPTQGVKIHLGWRRPTKCWLWFCVVALCGGQMIIYEQVLINDGHIL